MGDSGNTFSLKWENHHRNILTSIAALSNSESYSDITLCCEGQLFPVHRFILSCCSDYFSCLFEQLGGRPLVVVLKDIKLEELQGLLSYIYLGEVNISHEKLPALVKAAEFLKIKGLAVTEAGGEEDSPLKAGSESKREADSESSSGKHKKRKQQPVDPTRKFDINSNSSSRTEMNETEETEGNFCNNITQPPNKGVEVKTEPLEYLECSIPPDIKPDLSLDSLSSLSAFDDNPNKIIPSTSTPALSSCKYKSSTTSCTFMESTEPPGNMMPLAFAPSRRAEDELPHITDLLKEPSIEELFPEMSSGDGTNSSEFQSNNFWMMSPNNNNINSQNMQPAFDSRHYSCNALRQQNSKSAMLCNNQVKKAFSCPFENCLFSYKEKRALQDHINLHTGMQPYICNYCNYSTTHRTTLIQHKKHKHCQTVRNSSYGS